MHSTSVLDAFFIAAEALGKFINVKDQLAVFLSWFLLRLKHLLIFLKGTSKVKQVDLDFFCPNAFVFSSF